MNRWNWFTFGGSGRLHSVIVTLPGQNIGITKHDIHHRKHVSPFFSVSPPFSFSFKQVINLFIKRDKET